jgi:MFS transporter, LPLT family, lysophospholipid transporter
MPSTIIPIAPRSPSASALRPPLESFPEPPPNRRDYPLLLVGQFCSAFGDNFLLAALLSPLTFALVAGTISEQQVATQNALYSAVFFLPFILLAPLAGILNDRMPKSRWLLGGNVIKLFGSLCILASIGWTGSDAQWTVPLLGYALVGVGACLYSPAKYGILPEIVPAGRLVKANGSVELLTLLAILGGLWAGAVVYDHTGSLGLCAGVAIALYAVAAACSAGMRRSARQSVIGWRGSLTGCAVTLRTLLRHPRLGRILLGCAIFWFAGAVLRGNLQAWGVEVLSRVGVAHVTNQSLAWLKIALIAGIVAGSVLAGQLHRVGELGSSRRYGWAMAVGVALLGLLSGTGGLALTALVLLATGVAGGLLLVPLNAALQHEADPAARGRTIAIQNLVDYAGMLAGAGFLHLGSRLGFGSHANFVLLAVVLAFLVTHLRFSAKRAARG